MKTYPHHTPEGIIELVEKLEYDGMALLAHELATLRAEDIASLVEAKAENAEMRAAVNVAHEALDACKQFIGGAHIIEAQWNWEPITKAAEALTKLNPFLK